jgi:type IV pilus assembly protein PilY1
MKVTNLAPRALPRALAAAAAAAFLAAAVPAGAALTDIAGAPLASTSSGTVKPNVYFVLDTSGSMAWTHAPDDALDFLSRYGYKSAHCNSMYYDPKIKYVPPKKSDGTDYPNQSFSSALYDGFDSSSSAINLGSNFFAYDNTTSFGNGTDTKQAAYYYVYTGTQTVPDFTVSGSRRNPSHSTWYNECDSSIGSSPGKNVFTKVTVSSSSGPGATDERTNFANWFSYYRTRILMMKSGAGRAFSTIGDSYRVGFGTIYSTPSSSTTDPEFLAIGDFAQPQKDTWYSKFYATSPSGGTPLRTALSTAGRYFGGTVGPDPIQYSCQQNFLILTTDGYWNAGSNSPVKLDGSSSVGNQDNNATTMPRPMYDGNISGASNTLADAAAYYYNTDLRPSTGTCNTGVGGADVCTDNVPISGRDSAPWQHMTTFTLGLGVNGQLKYASDYLAGGSADFNAITSGSLDWPKPVGDTPTAVDDLWHAAVNGRGQYFSAQNPDLLVSGIRTALAGVTARVAAGAAAATSNLEPVAGDNSAFVANYRTQKWDGDVQSRTIDLVTGAISNVANWSAQQQLDGMVSATSDSRTIFTYLSGSKVDFASSSFTAAQKTAWFTPTASPALTQSGGWTAVQTTAATADTLINYIRGQNGFEMGRSANAIQLYRNREHVLGDIINGKPVYVKKPPFNYTENGYQSFKTSNAIQNRQGVVYVAANDGMLHAFNSDTGVEMWAYVPSFVLPNLKYLADDNYANAHRYYVDGSPTVTDVWTGSAWKTILIAGLNAGGKGYYALDVTNPGTPTVLWEFTDANLGLSYGNPVVGKLQDGTWVVAFTSGYNNADGVGRLYVLNAYTGALKFTLSTGVGSPGNPSGLGKISAWVDDALNDNTIKRIYGGDMLGNLWRFDVNDIIPPAGTEATLFATFQTAGGAQPITTVPELGLVSNKPIVFVGTGRYLGASDVVDTSQQSLYGLLDQLTAAGLGNVRNSPSCPLVKQSITILDANTRSTTTQPVDLNTQCGWYLDFPAPPSGSGSERVNVDPKLQLGVLAVATNVPANNICTVGGSSFLYFFDYATGQFVSTSEGHVAGTRLGNAIVVGLNTYRLPDGRVITTPTLSDDTRPPKGNPDNPLVGAIGKRVLWRELLN